MIGLLRSNLQTLLQRCRTDTAYRKLLLTSLTSFIIRVFGMFLGFLVTFITARFYGADALGIVSICIAILSFAAIITKLGMDIALVRYISEYFMRENFGAIKSLYLKAWKVMLPIGLLLTLILFLSSSFIAENIFHKPYLEELLMTNALLIIPITLLLINSEAIRSVGKINTYTFFQTCAVSLVATLLLSFGVLLFKDQELKYYPVYFQFIGIALAALISLVVWIKSSHWLESQTDEVASTRKLLKTSSPIFITTVMQLLMTWVGTLVLASYYSESDTGVYNAIVRISTFINITILAISSIAQPRLAAAYASGNMDEFKIVSKDSSRLIFISTLPLFLLLFLFPHFILSIFGKDFSGHENSLRLILAGQLFVGFAGLSSQILNMSDREKIMRNNAIISAIVNIAGCLILIPPYGIKGAIIAQVTGMVVWNLLSIISVRREFNFNSFYSPFEGG